MSETDERVVSMKFENENFEAGATKAIGILEKLEEALKFDGAESGVANLQKTMSNFHMDGISSAINTASSGFSAFEQIGIGALRRLGEEVFNFGEKIVKNLTNKLTQGARDGFSEYQMQMESIQTISANSGEDLKVITDNLEALNEYADKTSYSFSEMTQNIGRFTAAGLGVEESTSAIKGFANMAALAGAGSQETSRGMYQLSQAMAAGVVKLQDWKSIQNASIDTAAFKDILMETARVVDTNGVSVDAAIKKQGSFNASLSEGWLTANVMSQALQVATMSTRDFEDEEAGMQQRLKELSKMGYSEEVAKKLVGIANAADDSAREVRTLKQLMGNVEEAIGSGWARTWTLIVGNIDEATELFTTLGHALDSLIGSSSDARNAIIEDWKDNGGRDALIGVFANLAESIVRVIEPIKNAFSEVFTFSGKQLAVLTENLALLTQKFAISEETMAGIHDVFHSVFMIIKSVIGIVGNAFRYIGAAIDMFFWGFSGIKSIFSGLNSILEPIAIKLNSLHAAMDKAFSGVSKIIYMRKHFQELWAAAAASGDEAKMSALSNAMHTIWQTMADVGDTLHRIIWDAVDIVAQLLDFGLRLTKVLWTIIKPVVRFAGVLASTFLFDVLPKVIDQIERFMWNLKEFVGAVTNIASRVLKPVNRIFKELQKTASRFFKALASVITESEFFKTIVSWFDNIKRFLGDMLGRILPQGKLFGHTIAWYFIHPFKVLKDRLVEFNNNHKVKFFKTWLSDIANILGGPFNLAFSGIKWVIETLASLVSGPLLSGFDAIRSFFENGIDLSGGFGAVIDWFSSLSIGNPFENFAVPQIVLDKVDEFKTKLGELVENFNIFSVPESLLDKLKGLKKKFSDLGTSADDATWSLKTFIKKAGSKIKTAGKNRLEGVISTLSNSWSALKEYFKSLKGNSLGQNIKKVFGDIYRSVSDWAHNLANNTQGFVGAVAGLFASLLDQIGKIPSLFQSLFGTAKESVDTGVKNVGDSATKFKDEQETFWGGFIESITSIDIDGAISGFFTGIKDKFSNGLKSMFSGGENVDKNSLQSSITNLFDFSGFKIELPDWKTPIKQLVADFGDVLNGFPSEKIDEIVTNLETWATKIGKMGILWSGWGWIDSLRRLNNGLGKEGEGIGKFFEELPKSVKDGMTNLGKDFAGGLGDKISTGMTNLGTAFKDGLKAFKPFESKTTMFKNVAVGLLAVAGAMFVLAQIPADDLMRSAKALATFGIAMAGVMLVVGFIATMAKIDLMAVGKGFLGLGVGMLSMVAALYLFSRIPQDANFAVAINNFKLLIEVVSLAVIGIGLATKGSNMGGAAAAIISISVCMGLLIGVLVILNFVPDDWFSKGMLRMALMAGLISAAISVMGLATKEAGVGLLGASVAMIALIAAITLATIPLVLLAHIPEEWWLKGGTAMLGIGTVLGLAIAVFTAVDANLLSITAAIAGMLGVIAAITLAIIPVTILGLLPKDLLVKGEVALAVIGGILSALVAICVYIGASLLAVAAAAVGMTLLIIPITAMAGVIFLLSNIGKENLEAAKDAADAMLEILVVIAGIGVVGALGGALGLLGMAAGIAAVSAALGLLASVVDSIDLNKFSNDLRSLGTAVGEAGGNVVVGFAMAIVNGVGDIAGAALAMGGAFLAELCNVLGIQSPSKETEAIGEFTIEGLINGVLKSLGLVTDTGDETGGSLLDGLADLPTKMADSASTAINSFIDNIDTEEVISKGNEITAGIIQGIKSNAWEELTKIPGEIKDKIVGALKSLFGIQSPSTVMRDEIGLNIIQGLINGLTDGSLLGSLADAASSIGSKIVNGIQGLPENLGNMASNGVSAVIGFFTNRQGEAGEAGTGLGLSIKSGVNASMTGIETAATTGVKSIERSLAATSGIKSKSKATGEAVVSGIKPMSNKLKVETARSMAAMASAIKSGQAAAKTAARNLVTAVASQAKSLYSRFYTVGRDVVKGVINGINSLIPAARAKAAELSAILTKASKKKLDSNSPSKVFIQIGRDVVNGLIIGIDKMMGSAAKAGSELGSLIPESFTDTLSTMSVDIEDILDTDYTPEITPVINATDFDSGLNRLRSALGTGLNDFSVGNLNYTGELSAKISDYNDLNRMALTAMAENAIDYDLLGVKVANAFIASGVHVRMEGGQLVGYLAGEISDVRRMYE